MNYLSQAWVACSFGVGWALMRKRGHALLDFKTVSFALVRRKVQNVMTMPL